MFSKDDVQSWYIFYTYPRSEKKAFISLESAGYEVYIPLIESRRIWKNRQIKLITEPLFPNYIFVRITQERIFCVLENSKIVNYISCGTSPSKLNSEDIDHISKLLKVGDDISIDPEMQTGQFVKVIKGPLKGYEGVLTTKKGGARFGIEIKGLPYTISVEINSNCTRIMYP